MSKRLRVLFFPVGQPPVERTIPNTLDAIYKLLGVDCIDMCRPDRNIALVCDDSGLVNGSPPNVLAVGPTHLGAPIHGDCFVCGLNDDGDFCSLTDEEIERWKRLPRFRMKVGTSGVTFEVNERGAQ